MSVRQFLYSLTALLLLCFPTFTSAQEGSDEFIFEYPYIINRYDITYTPDSSGDLVVEENLKITYNQERRGILRDIPLLRVQEDELEKFGLPGFDDRAYLQDMEILEVKRNGKSENYEISEYEGDVDYRINTIRIGDADTYISGTHYYTVKYEFKNVASILDDGRVEYALDAVGDGWDTVVEESSAVFELPSGYEADQYVCYTGAFGSTDQDCKIEIRDEAVFFETTTELLPNESFTISTTLELQSNTGTTSETPQVEVIDIDTNEKRFYTLLANIGVFTPFIGLPFAAYIWYRFAKDDRASKIIKPRFDVPKEYPPLLLGALVDDDFSEKELAASIVHMAVQGYIEIIKDEDDNYTLKVTDKDRSDIDSFEEDLFKAIFKTKTDPGSEKDVSSIYIPYTFKTLKGKIYKNLAKDGYYYRDPLASRTQYFVIFGFAVTPFGLLAINNLKYGGYIPVIAMLIVATAFFLVGFVISQRTEKGSNLRNDILGLKEYLETAEADRLKFHQSTDSDQNLTDINDQSQKVELFEKLLPYAIVLGVEETWAEQFEGIYGTDGPSWFNGTTSDSFTTMNFVRSINSSSLAPSSAIQSRSSSGSGYSSSGGSFSSGGGFSGGGSGGGGGSSW